MKDSEIIKAFRAHFNFSNRELGEALGITEGTAKKLCGKNAKLSEKIRDRMNQYMIDNSVSDQPWKPAIEIDLEARQGSKPKELNELSQSSIYRRKEEFIKSIAEGIADGKLIRLSDMNEIEIEVFEQMADMIKTCIFPLASSDSFGLQMLAETCYDYIEARKDCEVTGNLEVNLKTGATKPTAAFTIMRQLREDFFKYCKDFGMTPKTRIALQIQNISKGGGKKPNGVDEDEEFV